MGFFRRNKKKNTGKEFESSPLEQLQAQHEAAHGLADSKSGHDDPLETPPRHVGLVARVLTSSADSDGPSRFASVVERRFGPDPERDAKRKKHVAQEKAKYASHSAFARHEHLRAVEPLLDDEAAESPKLEVDPMAHIGHATTITGDIVAEEDLEIQGMIEGSVRLANHRVTIGSDGIVKATVEAQTVLVIGKITGNVVATELVEIKAGGVIGGDVKAPRVIMNDGAIVVGGLDMSAALPSSAATQASKPPTPERPRLMRVELPDDPSSEKDRL